MIGRFSYVVLCMIVLYRVDPACGATRYVDPSSGQTIQDVLYMAETDDVIVLLDGLYVGTGNRDLAIPASVTRLLIQSDSHAAMCIIDAGRDALILSSQGVDLTISGITFRNGSGVYGGAVYCSGGALTVRHCEFHANSASQFGGALCLLNMDNVLVSNCLFSANSGNTGGAVYSGFSQTNLLRHCTFHANVSPGSAAVHAENCGSVNVFHSILWQNSTSQIICDQGTLTIEDCDIDQDVPGRNLRLNPLFVPASFGAHYLAHQDAGFAEDSPCVNAFNDVFAVSFPDIIGRTTSPYHFEDTDELDLGYHYAPDETFVTPTPTSTPTQTPLPTSTPTFKPVPTPTPEYAIHLVLEQPVYSPGDRFNLHVSVSNWIARKNPLRLFVVLDVFSEYFMHPSWNPDYDFQYVSIPVGESGVPILDFIWPASAGSASGLMFHAAFMDSDGQEIICIDNDILSGIASVEFGFAE